MTDHTTITPTGFDTYSAGALAPREPLIDLHVYDAHPAVAGDRTATVIQLTPERAVELAAEVALAVRALGDDWTDRLVEAVAEAIS
ncbi:MAG: hypothetical protein IE935_13265 [Micrococcales bacterium]|nr:hypothetical protein [Micrococcales bacterium]